MVAAAVAGGSAVAGLAGSAIQSSGASSAAKANAKSQQSAIDQQNAMYQQTRADLQPYVQAGYSVLPEYSQYWKLGADQLGQAYADAYNHIPGPMDEATLQKTPGYRFALDQGTKALQNSAAARGLGVSGAALGAGANYATGLADQTYKDQFGIQQQIYNDWVNQANLKGSQLGQIWNYLSGPATLGENAAAQTGTAGSNAANANSQSYGNIGATNANAAMSSANSWSNALNSAGSSGLNYLGIQNALGNSGSGSGGSGSSDDYNTAKNWYQNYSST